MDISLHCMSEVERYLKFCPAEDYGKSVSLAIRLETDRAMADYLNQNKRTYKNVFAIEESCITISLQDLIDDNLDSSAKAFNHIYSKIELDGDAPNELDEKEAWRQLALVRRDSNRALALHDGVKETLLNTFWGDDHSRLSRYFGPEGSIIKLENKTWCVNSSDDVFIQKLAAVDDGEVLTELAKLEHRRWCYYMASRGWKCTADPTMKKNDATKENPCLRTWHALVKNQAYMCKYDLMPLLYRIQRSE